MHALVFTCALLAPSLQEQAAPEPPASGARVMLEDPAGGTRVVHPEEFETTDPRKLGSPLVHFVDFPLPEQEDRGALAEIQLLGGDQLRGAVRTGSEDIVQIEVVAGVDVSVSIEEITSIRFPDRIPIVWTGALVSADVGDRLFRRQFQGLDQMNGTVEEFSDEGVRFLGLLGSKVVPWDEVAALFVDDLGAEAVERPPGEVPVVIDILGGSRLRGELGSIDGKLCRLRTAAGDELEIPAWAIRLVTVDDGSVRHLSERGPDVALEGSPFGDGLGMQFVHRIDREVREGGPLRVGGVDYPRGIGVHAPSTLTWRLDGSWSFLRGRVGVDDVVLRLPAQGSVVFRVHVDGEERWASSVLRGGDRAVVIPAVDLKGARELVLEADMAGDFFAGDRADWLGMLLVRSGPR